ncbi:hypothetical protein FTUN_4530 [Frigoriglobus tundricola]|uniref:Uncharacterized protein n=1 Tax=Frigoriglobus tundricola TaxID=2774151 RepID=A0A6M5YUB8_9BACT|nr:hypothetical protein FTUN_4530 [Frigoriglobus tundricola]
MISSGRNRACATPNVFTTTTQRSHRGHKEGRRPAYPVFSSLWPLCDLCVVVVKTSVLLSPSRTGRRPKHGNRSQETGPAFFRAFCMRSVSGCLTYPSSVIERTR